MPSRFIYVFGFLSVLVIISGITSCQYIVTTGSQFASYCAENDPNVAQNTFQQCISMGRTGCDSAALMVSCKRWEKPRGDFTPIKLPLWEKRGD